VLADEEVAVVEGGSGDGNDDLWRIRRLEKRGAECALGSPRVGVLELLFFQEGSILRRACREFA
jgi:hypothetical protein